MDPELKHQIDSEHDTELDLEQKYLDEVRQFIEEYGQIRLAHLSELQVKADRLFKQSGGTFSQEYELTHQSIQLAKARSGQFEESRTKPYFGRIDFRERLAHEPESLYIGKHSVRDNDSTSDYVIDWRAPVAELYYSGTLGRNEFKAPGGYIEGDLTLKRRYTYTKGDLPVIDRYFDEGDQILVSGDQGEGKALQDEFLRINLEESSTEKLKEIVATIAREQNVIIRAQKNIPLVVQGAAGAGKTTVALHRLAYLLYQYKDNMKGSDVCIIAPNRLFLDYISEILPDLGTKDVMQTTLEDIILKDLAIKTYTWNKDDILKSILEAPQEEARLNGEMSRLKGSRAYMDLLDAMGREKEWEESLRGPILVADQVLYSADEILRLYTKDLLYLPLNERRKEIQTYCTRNIKKRMDQITRAIEQGYTKKVNGLKNIYRDDEPTMRQRIIETYAQRDLVLKNLPQQAKANIKAYFKEFKEESVLDIYERYLHREEFLRTYLTLSEDHLKRLLEFDAKQIEADDLSALMYLSIRINGAKHSWSHIVVDEAQDYTLLQLEVIRQLARQDSMTLVGDLAQGIYSYRAISDWDQARSLFSGGADYYELRNSYRSTLEIIEEANLTLRRMNLPLEEAIPVLRHGRAPLRQSYKDLPDLLERLSKVESVMAQDHRNTLAIVTKTFKEAKTLYKELKGAMPGLELIDEHKRKSSLKKVVIPSYMAKGLEFDCVVLMDTGSFGDNSLDLRLRYVALTRALHLEYILNKSS